MPTPTCLSSSFPSTPDPPQSCFVVAALTGHQFTSSKAACLRHLETPEGEGVTVVAVASSASAVRSPTSFVLQSTHRVLHCASFSYSYSHSRASSHALVDSSRVDKISDHGGLLRAHLALINVAFAKFAVAPCVCACRLTPSPSHSLLTPPSVLQSGVALTISTRISIDLYIKKHR